MPLLIVDLVIPARNEQDNIAALLCAIPAGVFRHIVLVDNGSTDRTAELARAGGAVVVDAPAPGYGAACLAGLAWLAERPTQADAVAFVDADLADDPAELPALIAAIAEDRADLVIGSRPALAEPGALTALQRFGNRLACTLIRWTTGRRYTDLGPMRVIRWTSLGQLHMRDRTWGWTVEMQFKAAATGLRTLEVDVPYRRRHAGKSKISGTISGSIRAGWKIITTIAILWWGHTRSAAQSTADVQAKEK